MIKRITYFLSLLMLCIIGSKIYAQDNFKLPKSDKRVKCYTVETINEQRKNNPTLETDAQFEAWLAPLVKQHQNTSSVLPIKPYKMAIVFHVIYSGEAVGVGTNVSQDLIVANVLQLNKDYANLSNSTYSVASNTGLQFALAKVDPSGTTLAEPGIDRIDATQQGWSTQPWATTYINSTIKPATIWDPTKYVNIWIAPMSGGILGIATFPASSTLTGLNSTETATTAGVIIDPTSVGSVFNAGGGCGSTTYNLGKTLSHELGHFFGLRHIWGDNQPNCGDDYVADTPASDQPSYGTHTHPYPSVPCGTADQMFENYMDYTDDHQLNTFTRLQVDRMQTVMLNSPRRKTLPTAAISTVDAVGTDSLKFAECIGAVTYLETANSGSYPRYHDVDILLTVDGLASDSADVVISTGGTATPGYDYDILNANNTVHFNKGDGSQPIKLRIYDNAVIDGDRNILLTYSINGAGVQPAAAAQSLLVTVMDDDGFSVGQNNINIFSETFGTAGGTLPTNWGLAQTTNYPSPFVVGTKGSAGGSGQCAYVSNNATTKPNTYTKGTSGVAVIATPTISGQNYQTLGSLSFKFKVRGLANADEAYTLYRVAYDTTKALNFFGNTSGTTGYGPYSGGTTTLTGTPTLATTSDMNSSRFRVWFYWRTGTATTGANPGFNLDDVVFTATPFNVETAKSSSYPFDIPNTTISKFKSTNGKALAILLDSSSDITKFKIDIIDAGTSKKNITLGGNSFSRSSKVFKFTDSIGGLDTTTPYTVAFYYTASELAAWGANKTGLKVLHVFDGTDILTASLNKTNSEILTPYVVDSSAGRGYLTYSVLVNGMGSFALVDSNAVLPVNLITFNGKLNNKVAALNWVTTNEINNKGFYVERSTNGKDFASIGWVNASLVAGNKSYFYNDEKISSGNKYYYRLKQLDNDGKFTYSSIVIINYTATDKLFSVYPNPIKNQLFIQNNSGNNLKAEIIITDESGKRVYSNSTNISGLFTLETSNWSKGAYFIQVKYNDNNSTSNLIKQ